MCLAARPSSVSSLPLGSQQKLGTFPLGKQQGGGLLMASFRGGAASCECGQKKRLITRRSCWYVLNRQKIQTWAGKRNAAQGPDPWLRSSSCAQAKLSFHQD